MVCTSAGKHTLKWCNAIAVQVTGRWTLEAMLDATWFVAIIPIQGTGSCFRNFSESETWRTRGWDRVAFLAAHTRDAWSGVETAIAQMSWLAIWALGGG